MWFSPWRRILRGRSGDAKPSGLRAGTKFVEEDTGVEYTYDPVMQNWKKKVAPYSALVAKDGSTVWAEDSSGKTIASGEAGVDDASVIQSAVNAISEGKILIRKGTYKITQKISCPAGIFFESEGAELDLSSLNDVAFQFGSDDDAQVVKFTGLRGFFVTASSANTNTLLARASQIIGLMFEKIRYENLNNFLEARGACYSLVVRDCGGFYLHGVFVKLVTLDKDGVVYKPNNAEIIHSGFSNSWSDTGGSGVEIYSSQVETSSGGSVGAVKIRNCWFEGCDIGIYSEGKCTMIANNHITPASSGKAIYLNAKKIDSSYIVESGEAGIIIGNYITPSLDNSYGVYLEGPTSAHLIVGNYFHYIKGTAIYCANGNGIRVVGNRFGIGYDTGVGLSGTLYHSQVVGNVFGGDLSSPRGTGINADGVYITIEGNEFLGLKYSINAPSLNAIREEGNIFCGNTNDPSLGTKYRNSGSKTFSGDGSTTDFSIGAHGLVTTDPSKIAVKITPASSDAIAASPCVGYVDPADNTKIRVKFSSAPASGSENVKIVWYAEVVS